MISKGIDSRSNNNRVERFFCTVKDRTRVMRGGFGNLESGTDSMRLATVYYNNIRPHMGLGGRTPAEAAGIDLGLGQNRMLDLIIRSAEYGDDKHREN